MTRSEVVSHAEDRLPPLWARRAAVAITKDNTSSRSGGIFEGHVGASPLKREILQQIESAKEVVLVSSFLLADPEVERVILRAAARGVRTYVLTASENRLRVERNRGSDSEEELDRFDEHSALLRRLEGRVLVRTGEDLHAKFVVVDPSSDRPSGVLSTANFTTKALAGNPEVGVGLDADAARDLARLFSCGFWYQSQHEWIGLGSLLPVVPRQGTPPLPKHHPYTALGRTELREALMEAITGAEGELTFACYGFDSSHPVAQELVKAAQKGLSVRIMTRPRDRGEAAVAHNRALVELGRAGASVRGHPDLHAKALLWKQGGKVHGLVMTANVTNRGLDTGYEAAVRVEGSTTQALANLLGAWWERMPWEFRVGASLGEVLGEVRLWRGMSLEDTRVEEEAPPQVLPRLTAKSVAEAETSRPSNFPPPRILGRPALYHKVPYTWDVVVKETPKRVAPKERRESSETELPSKAES